MCAAIHIRGESHLCWRHRLQDGDIKIDEGAEREPEHVG